MTPSKMKAADAFGLLHPGVGFLLFGLAVLLTVLFMHPVVLGVSFCCAVAYALYLGRGKALRFLLCVLLPVMVLSAVLNPAFNHRGATILFYLSTGNPVTAESLYYGAAGSLMIGSVLMWFYCYNAVMDSDKLIWLLGRPAPALALTLSMALRLVPRCTAQAKRVAIARAGLGRGVEAGGIISRARDGLTILSTMTTWALENAVDTADSMASRGFGLKDRTAYSNYRLDRRSACALTFLALTGMACVVLAATGAVGVVYFPRFELSGSFAVQAAMVVCWAAICAFPVVLDVWEGVRFKRALGTMTRGEDD
jgi:energy-coupling factor transport system permease protein